MTVAPSQVTTFQVDEKFGVRQGTQLLSLLLCLASTWVLTDDKLMVLVFIATIFVTLKYTSPQLALLAVFQLMRLSVIYFDNPYSGYASIETTRIILLSITLITVTWQAIITFGPARVLHPPKRLILPKSSIYYYLIFFGFAGLLSSMYRFRSGIPLFSDNIDEVRNLARENTNILVGILQEGWTLGVMLSLLSILVMKNRKKIDWVILTAFLMGAFAGGSRNSLLIGIVPALIGILLYQRTQVSTKKITFTLSLAKKLLIIAGLIGAIFLLFTYSGSRTVNGEGAFETAFRQQYGNDTKMAAVASLDLALSAPFETWSRIYLQKPYLDIGDREYYSFAFAGSLLEKFGHSPNLDAISVSVSSPYFMNAATMVSAPYLDFGIIGVIVFSILLGTVNGFLGVQQRKSNSLFISCIYGYSIYLTILALYAFPPFKNIAWVPVVGILAFLAMREQKVASTTREPSE